MRAIGLMSGTSLDGVDVALIDTDGENVEAFGPVGYRAYAEAERALLRQALADAEVLTDRTARPGVLSEAERVVTQAHAEAVEAFLAANHIACAAVDIVGFHGQTVLHRPAARLTVQLGDGAWLARRLGLPVVHDLRAADVAAGGQGAPLVPVYHRALALGLDRPGPVAVLNLGGVANVTFLDGPAEPLAFDLGPANALIDDFMKARTGQALDRDGRAASAGRADEAALARLMAHPFFAAPPPKSLDRNDFRAWVARKAGLDAMGVEDGAATLTALTAEAVAASRAHVPTQPRTWIAAGGGARNPTLMALLSERLAPAQLVSADALGWSADHMEAQAFAFLAVRSLKGLPLTYPSTTGVAVPLTGGVVARP